MKSGCCDTFSSKKVFDHFKSVVKFQAPTKSDKKGHYKTFLEGCLNEAKTHGDSEQATANTKNLGSCEFYPSYSIKSKTGKEGHYSLFGKRMPFHGQAENSSVLFMAAIKHLTANQKAAKHSTRDCSKQSKSKKSISSKVKTRKMTIADIMRKVYRLRLRHAR